MSCGGGFGSGGSGCCVTRSTEVIISYADLSAAALSSNFPLFSLPAGAIYQGHKMKVTTAFLGGAIATYQLSVGPAGTLEKYQPLSDVLTAPTDTDAVTSNVFATENEASATSIRVQGVSTGANLDAATQGSATFEIFYLTP